MHLIAVDEAARVMLNTQFVDEDPRNPVWPLPLFRLQLRTDRDSGVILEFSDPRTLRLLAAAIRTLLTAHRHARANARAAAAAERALRPTQRTFAGI